MLEVAVQRAAQPPVLRTLDVAPLLEEKQVRQGVCHALLVLQPTSEALAPGTLGAGGALPLTVHGQKPLREADLRARQRGHQGGSGLRDRRSAVCRAEKFSHH